jgi:hypothetical protein
MATWRYPRIRDAVASYFDPVQPFVEQIFDSLKLVSWKSARTCLGTY